MMPDLTAAGLEGRSRGGEVCDVGGLDTVSASKKKKKHPLEHLLNEQVVLDTGTPILYIGTLNEITDDVFVLSDTDMHDCRDGHANQEVYLAEARDDGVAVNRRSVVVMRTVVISVSRLADIVIE